VTNLQIAARVLQAVPNDCYCDACLASALQLPVSTTVEIAATLARRLDYERRHAACVACGRTTTTIVYVPFKCARCSRPIDDADLVIDRGDRFHHHCWQILESAKQVADSRQMARLSRELIRRSLERLKPRDRR